MKIRENEAVELRCVVHDAKPKATIVWFRENTEFITGNLNRNFDSFRTKLNSTNLNIIPQCSIFLAKYYITQMYEILITR